MLHCQNTFNRPQLGVFSRLPSIFGWLKTLWWTHGLRLDVRLRTYIYDIFAIADICFVGRVSQKFKCPSSNL